MIFYDTNALIFLKQEAFKEKFYISDVTLSELEHIKTSRSKDESVKHSVRRVNKLLDENPDLYEVIFFSPEWTTIGSVIGDTPDSRICACARHAKDVYGSDLIFVTGDISCKTIASRIFGLSVKSVFDYKEPIYTGYKEIKGDTNTVNYLMENMDLSDWSANEYLLITNTEENTVKEMRFDGTKFVALKLPPSKFIKGKNALQRCALDLLLNPDITVCAVLGGYGSGKSHLSMKMGLYLVRDKGTQSRLLGVREPRGEGAPVGYLPGSLEDKTDLFFAPLAQQLDNGEFELEQLKQRGQIDCQIPYYLKGTTFNETIILCDEAEDLDEKQLKLVGTRLGKNSQIFFAGDYKQSLIDTSANNALVRMCNEFKGNPKFGCIYLGEDVRSTTSKMFATLFE